MDVKIMSRKSLMELAKEPFSSDVAVISITNSDYEDVPLQNQPDHILRLKFDDVSDEIFEEILGRKPNVQEMHKICNHFHMLSNFQTQLLADFVLSRDQSCTLICQCEHGQSRSAGVAAAIMEYYYGRGINIFADSRYYPNKYIYRKLLRSLRTRGGVRCPSRQTSMEVQCD